MQTMLAKIRTQRSYAFNASIIVTVAGTGTGTEDGAEDVTEDGAEHAHVELGLDDIAQLQMLLRLQRAGLDAKHAIALGKMREFLMPLGEHVYRDDTHEIKEHKDD